MERFESCVVQVEPGSENAKIKEMEMFGWNLHGRQEIHEWGEAEVFKDNGGYMFRKKVRHYVKLHFVRSLSTPNLDKIKRIENEYFSLPFPQAPFPLVGVGILGVLLSLPNVILPLKQPVSVRLLCLGLAALFGLLAYWCIRKCRSARATCEASLARRQELLQQVRALLE